MQQQTLDTQVEKFFSYSFSYLKKKPAVTGRTNVYPNWFPDVPSSYSDFFFQDQNIQNYIDAYVKAPFPKAKFKEFLILTRCNVIRQSGNNDVLLELGVSPHNVNRQGVHQRIQDEDTINAKKFRIVPAVQEQFRQMTAKCFNKPMSRSTSLMFNNCFDKVDIDFAHHYDTSHPKHIATQIAYLLTKKGWGFRRAVDEVLPDRQRINKGTWKAYAQVPNVFVEINGRAGKAMMAQNFKMRRGSLSRQTIANKVIVGSMTSVTKRHGTRNVKVWVSLK